MATRIAPEQNPVAPVAPVAENNGQSVQQDLLSADGQQPEKKKSRKGRTAKPDYVLPVNDEGQPILLTDVIPSDYNPETHSLKKSHFQEEYHYLLFKASEYEAKAATMRHEAEELKKLGSAEDRAKAKRLLAMSQRMAELRAQLEAAGYDVDAMMK